MKKILHVILISLFSLTIISCGEKEESSSSSSTSDTSTTITDNTTTDTTASSSSSATAITTGFANHTCALLDNASVKCWGNNLYGQLGIDNNTNMGDNTGEMAALPSIDL